MKINKKKVISQTIIMILISAIVVIEPSYAMHYPALPDAWKELMNEYRFILAGISGIGALTSILIFIAHMIQLGGTGNPQRRSNCIRNILISAICTALLGGMTLITTLFYSIIFL